MKTLKVVVVALMVGFVLDGSHWAVAALSDFSNGGSGTSYSGGGSSLNQVIPDNTPAGVGYSINFAPVGLTISDISVALNLSGGFNNDIYAYLAHGSQIAVLLNQITGSPGTAGFNVTLTTGTGNDIQTYTGGSVGQPLAGTYLATGGSLATFDNADPNGAWTLFFADRNPGDTSLLNSFSVTITAVPEPVNLALLVFAVLPLPLVGHYWIGRGKSFSGRATVDDGSGLFFRREREHFDIAE
jgi:subtilisin-like proprotein convertase family protein